MPFRLFENERTNDRAFFFFFFFFFFFALFWNRNQHNFSSYFANNKKGRLDSIRRSRRERRCRQYRNENNNEETGFGSSRIRRQAGKQAGTGQAKGGGTKTRRCDTNTNHRHHVSEWLRAHESTLMASIRSRVKGNDVNWQQQQQQQQIIPPLQLCELKSIERWGGGNWMWMKFEY